jgi:chromosome segregation ATPase
LPNELDEIRRRLDVLESRMDSEAGLRAMMDLDQASLTVRLDAQDNLLRALAVTQSEHTRRLTRLEDGHRRLEEGQQRLEEGQQRLEEGQQRLEGAQQRLEGAQQRLEGAQQRLEGTVAQVEAGIQTIIGMLDQDR